MKNDEINKQDIDDLIEMLKIGDKMQSVISTKKIVESGASSEFIVANCIEPAMIGLNNKCTVENFNLLEVMLAGRAVMSVMKELFPPGSELPPTKGTIILATLEGDVHDLGKNILKTVLTVNGYNIIDLGKNCPLEKLIDAAEEKKPFIIGVSGLITSVIPIVERIKVSLSERNMEHIKVIAGGAALKQATAELLRVDFLGETAFDGGNYIDSLKNAAN